MNVDFDYPFTIVEDAIYRCGAAIDPFSYAEDMVGSIGYITFSILNSVYVNYMDIVISADTTANHGQSCYIYELNREATSDSDRRLLWSNNTNNRIEQCFRIYIEDTIKTCEIAVCFEMDGGPNEYSISNISAVVTNLHIQMNLEPEDMDSSYITGVYPNIPIAGRESPKLPVKILANVGGVMMNGTWVGSNTGGSILDNSSQPAKATQLLQGAVTEEFKIFKVNLDGSEKNICIDFPIKESVYIDGYELYPIIKIAYGGYFDDCIVIRPENGEELVKLNIKTLDEEDFIHIFICTGPKSLYEEIHKSLYVYNDDGTPNAIISPSGDHLGEPVSYPAMVRVLKLNKIYNIRDFIEAYHNIDNYGGNFLFINNDQSTRQFIIKLEKLTSGGHGYSKMDALVLKTTNTRDKIQLNGSESINRNIVVYQNDECKFCLLEYNDTSNMDGELSIIENNIGKDKDNAVDLTDSSFPININTVKYRYYSTNEDIYLKFKLLLGYTYRFSSAGFSDDGDPDAILYNENMNISASNDDVGGGYNFEINYKCLKSGLYYLAICNSDTVDVPDRLSGWCRLIVIQERSGGYSFDRAVRIPLNDSSTTVINTEDIGLYNYESPVYYKIHLDKGFKYKFSCNTYSNGDPCITLYNSNKGIVATNTDDVDLETSRFNLIYSCTSTEYYYIAIGDEDYFSKGSSCVFSIEDISDPGISRENPIIMNAGDIEEIVIDSSMPDPLYIKLINMYGDTSVVLNAYLFNNGSTSMASLAIEDSSGNSLVGDGIELDGNSTQHSKATSKFILDFADNYAVINNLGLSDGKSIYFGVNYFGTVYKIPGSSITPYNMSPIGIDALSLTSNDAINGRIVIELDDTGEPFYTVTATNDRQSTNIARVSFYESETNEDDLLLGADDLDNGEEASCTIMKPSSIVINNIADGTEIYIKCENANVFPLNKYSEMMVDYITVPDEEIDTRKDSVQINAIKVRESSSSSWVTIDEIYLDVSLPYIASLADIDENVRSIIIVQYPESYSANNIHVEYSYADITSENYKENNPSAVDAKVLVYKIY